jgi:sugar porter (SP) family MFS transporter
MLPDCIEMSETEFATISSVYTLGGLLGALVASPIGSKRGRLLVMRSTAVLFVIGAIIETISKSVFALGGGRLISGVGAGAATVIVPLYISELAPPAERGLFGAMTQVSINIGLLLTQTLGYFFSYGNAWRWILVIGVGMGIVHVLGLVVTPESPTWLAAHGDASKAKRTLQRIRGHGVDINEEVESWNIGEREISAEQEGLLAQRPEEPSATAAVGGKQVGHLGFIQVVKDPLTRPAIIAVVGIMFAQQLCGINSIIMYSVSILNGVTTTDASLLAIAISVVNLLTTIASSPLPDRFGRKTCILLSIIGQGCSSLILALSMIFGAKVLSALSVLSFVAFFAIGLGPVPFILASELVGQEAVGATQSWGLAANYITTFLVAQFFPIINDLMNKAFGGAGWVFFIFAGFALISAIFVSWHVPETKGKKDADEVWGRTRRLD